MSVLVHRHSAFLFARSAPLLRWLIASLTTANFLRPAKVLKILWGLFEGLFFKIGSTQSLLKVR
jgi:hypothetical protein